MDAKLPNRNEKLAGLVCAACGAEYALKSGTTGLGVVACGCREVAIVDEVLVLGGELAGPALAAVRRRDGRARELLLGAAARRLSQLAAFGVRPNLRSLLPHPVLGRIVATELGARVATALRDIPVLRQLWRRGHRHLYFRYRPATTSFLASLPLLGLLDGVEGLVLDAPCGMGHFARRLLQHDPRRLVALDLDPYAVYLARQFSLPEGAVVGVADLCQPLPLAAASVGAAFVVDGLHCFPEKQAFAAELGRVLRPDGVMAFVHLHNRLGHNVSPHDALSPAEYRALFSGHDVRLVPENHLLDAYLRDEPFDLAAEVPAAEVDRADAVFMFVAGPEFRWPVLPAVRSRLAEAVAEPSVSEFYEPHHRAGALVFRRRLPPTIVEEFPRLPEVLPAEIEVEPDRVRMRSGRLTVRGRQDLVGQHVLLDLPSGF